MLTKSKVCQRLSTRLSTQKPSIYKGSEGFTYNNTIKKVKLYKKIKVKIIIENIVFVVCCLHWLHLKVDLTLPPQAVPLPLKGTASLGSPFKGSCQTESLTEGSFCILHFAFNWVGLLGGRPMGAPTVMVFVGLTLPTASQPPFPPETGTLLSLRDISPNRGITLKGTASLGSPFKGSCQTEGLTEGSFCVLHFAFKKAPEGAFLSRPYKPEKKITCNNCCKGKRYTEFHKGCTLNLIALLT